MLKRYLVILLLAGFVYLATPHAFAQDSESNDQQSGETSNPPEHHHRGGGHFDPSKRAEMMAKHLNLNSDQQSKVQSLLQSEQSQMQSLRADSSVSQQDRHSKMMDIHKSTNDQIRALLDSTQQQKFDAMQKQREEHMQERRGNAPPSGSPDDSQQN
jgi:Spy/CpxP family protein refolding chaperone